MWQGRWSVKGLSHRGETPEKDTGEEMGHSEAAKHASRNAYSSLFIDFDTMDVTAWRGHQAGNDAPSTRPVSAKLTEPTAYENQIRVLRGCNQAVAESFICIWMEKVRQTVAGCGLTEVFPIGYSVPRAAHVRREGILELCSFWLNKFMKDCSVVKNRRLVFGAEIEPLTRQSR
jgi:hypothetical protein